MPALKKIGAAALAAFGWTSGGAAAVTASYLVVAGGGGGGTYASAGGGGAGGLLTGTTSLNPTLSYTVVVGAGGTGKNGGSGSGGSNGTNSSFNAVTSIGGGVGASANPTNPAGNGGSGGGGAANSQAFGTGTAGQGNNGGNAIYSSGNYPGGGGGGAGAVGQDAPNNSTAGNGGVGVSSSISGTATFYAGGGGGSVQQAGGTAGSGGNGGGGAGGNQVFGTAGTANTGGGAGASAGVTANGPNGGSGIVIISYTGAQQFGGGIVTSVGGNTIHTFTTSGTLSPLSSLSASYLIVAGGGGASIGGGGAGGMLTGSGVTIDTNSTYLITVGSGGSAATNGSNSSFSMVSTSAVGGGRGAGFNANGTAGGSGGGAATYFSGSAFTGGTATAGQGNAGGNSVSDAGASNGGGGGGAGAVGANGTSGGNGGNGGVGLTSSISGTSTYYAGGGGGAGQGGTSGSGGLGGGGAGAYASGTSGTANTGGGGGGGISTSSGSGGSGIVIISYAGATQQMAGGSVTITGGNVIHTFTSSGYLTPLTYYSNSLRFRASNSAYLSRTPPVASNRKTWTYSLWFKKSCLGVGPFILWGNQDSGGYNGMQFNFQNDVLIFADYNASSAVSRIDTTQVFRDPAAWYHVVVAYDTTQATASNRIKLYVNGLQVTALSVATYPSQNYDGYVNNTSLIAIGRNGATNGYYFDGYMSNINFIDGQALTPNSFGTFNSYGVWQPINYGGSYGTNGFYLPFNSGSQTYAASFNGSTQNLLTSTNANLALGTNNFTVEYWINPISTPSGAVPVSAGGGTVVYDPLFGYQPASTATTLYLSSTGTSFDIRSGGALATTPIGVWTHVAITRSGSTFYTFCNGVQTSTFTSSASIYQSANSFSIGKAQGNSITNAYISNVRVVIGSAVYTSNFIPSTTALTAITNTQLLTLQNATIIDNSANATAITNNGTVATATAKPLSTAVFQDQSPQGNNWTPNNISGATGSTLDYMTDVPTLTSATAANTCTYNPLNNGGTVTNGNLRFSNTSGAYNSCAGTIGVSSGKFYWEVTMTTYSPSGNTVGITASTEYWPTIASYVGSTASSYGYYNGGQKYNNATGASYGASYTTGDVIGVALDMTAGTLIFYKNGTSQGTAYTGLTGTFMPGVSAYNNGTPLLDINFGQQPFKYTPPAGFVALNTYNL